MNYDEAIKRLNEIVERLESDELIGLDEYKKLAAEAKELIAFCRNEILNTEQSMAFLKEK